MIDCTVREEDVFFNDDQDGRVSLCDSHSPQGQSFILQRKNRTRQLNTIGNSPATLITKHISYAGNITGEEAEQKLSRSKGPSYLIRFSNNNNRYVLSIKTDMNIYKHYGLTEENQQYRLDVAYNSFPTIDALLEHYKNTPIDPTEPNTCLGKPENDPGVRRVEESDLVQRLMEENRGLKEMIHRQDEKFTQLFQSQQEILQRLTLQQPQGQLTPQNQQLPQPQGQPQQQQNKKGCVIL